MLFSVFAIDIKHFYFSQFSTENFIEYNHIYKLRRDRQKNNGGDGIWVFFVQ